MVWPIRLAREADVPILEELIRLSTRTLQASYYSSAQIEAALGPIFAVDHQLIRDGTYFVVEEKGAIVACGGWSKRKAFYGGGNGRETEESELDPCIDSARIRAFFVHPTQARQGIGRAILGACEGAIQAAGFLRADLSATLAGEPLYAASGYVVKERYEIPMSDGLTLPVVLMSKSFQKGRQP